MQVEQVFKLTDEVEDLLREISYNTKTCQEEPVCVCLYCKKELNNWESREGAAHAQQCRICGHDAILPLSKLPAKYFKNKLPVLEHYHSILFQTNIYGINATIE